MNGYRRHEHRLPRMPPPPWPPATEEGHAMERAFLEAVELAAKFEAEAKPWTLVRLIDEPTVWVANRRSWWMRLRTWWLNRQRRELNRRHLAHLASQSSAKYAAETACPVPPSSE